MSPSRHIAAIGSRGVDLSTAVGSLTCSSSVMTASGTSGHGAELASYFDLRSLGAVVVKSLLVRPWPGNPAPRVHPLDGAMLNSVGLQGPGLAWFLEQELPALEKTGAAVVVSIWGQRVDDYAVAAEMLANAPSCVKAIEVNVSCPNVEDRSKMFAHSPSATREVVSAARGKLPLWVKLSPNVADIVEIADAALSAGAEALTLVNTLLALQIDLNTRRPSLGAGGGGMSGRAVHPVAVRAVYDCRAAFPDAAIIGVGGVFRGEDVVEFHLAGANAVQVGTATLAEPKAASRILGELEAWCAKRDVKSVRDLIGGAHG